MTDDIIKRLRETSGAIFSTAPWHAPGLGEVFDAGNRCIAICIDCDPVEEHERPVPAHDEGELIAKHIAATSPDNIAALLDRLDQSEKERATLWEAIGLASTIKGDMEIDTSDPLGMMQQVARHADAAERENERLRKFAGNVLEKSREEFLELSCADIEDWATQCGLLEQVTMTAACGDDCKCAEWTDFPLECLRQTALGSAAIDAARAAEQSDERSEK